MSKRQRKVMHAELQSTLTRLIREGKSLVEIVIATNLSVTKVIDMMHHPLNAKKPQR